VRGLQPAIVLRKYDYSETSQILRLLTRDTGVVGALAKGSKKEKSSFGGALDLFYLGDARIVFRPRSGLHILAGFHVRSAHRELRRELARFYTACHLAEVITGMTREEEPHPRLFERLREGLALLERAPRERVPPLAIALLLGLLAELGFAPSLTVCALCGSEAGRRGNVLSVSRGGLLCPDCREQEPAPRTVSPGVLGALRALAAGPPEGSLRLRLSGPDARSIRGFLTAFVEWQLERPLRTARFWGQA